MSIIGGRWEAAMRVRPSYGPGTLDLSIINHAGQRD